jgi:hypothetical protein
MAVVSSTASALRDETAAGGQRLSAASGQIPKAAQWSAHGVATDCGTGPARSTL